MIVCNGLVGLCIFIGGLRYREQDFQVSGANLYLSVLFVLATITLIMPNYTLTAPGPIYSAAQLGFVSVVTLVLYGVFLYTQTIRHRDYFISEAEGDAADDGAPLSNRMLALSIALLLVSLLAVVLLAKKFSLVVDVVTAMIGAPPAFAGVLVALLILLPEGVAAVAAARKNDLQKEHQSGARLVARHHRADDSGGRGGRLRARQATGARAQRAGDGAAAADLRHQHAHLRHRPHQHPVRAGAYGGVRRVPVHGIRAVILRSEPDMLSAKSDVQVDTPEVRVTEWRLAPGSATSHHTHEMDYVIVPVTSGEMTIVAPTGERSKAQLGVGKSYFRKPASSTTCSTRPASEIVFLEVELKPDRRWPVGSPRLLPGSASRPGIRSGNFNQLS